MSRHLRKGKSRATLRRLSSTVQIDVAMPGFIDVLIKHNESTSHLKRGSQRLRNSPLDISLIHNINNRKVDVQSIQKPMIDPSYFQTVLDYENKISWKTIVPLQFLLKGWGDANRGYQCYMHTISKYVSRKINPADIYTDLYTDEAVGSDHYPYVGITGRNWLDRFREHMGEMGRGSRKRFHSAWRQSTGQEHVHFSLHLLNINLTYKEAMSWVPYNKSLKPTVTRVTPFAEMANPAPRYGGLVPPLHA
jgi:hypothetical protein